MLVDCKLGDVRKFIFPNGATLVGILVSSDGLIVTTTGDVISLVDYSKKYNCGTGVIRTAPLKMHTDIRNVLKKAYGEYRRLASIQKQLRDLNRQQAEIQQTFNESLVKLGTLIPLGVNPDVFITREAANDFVAQLKALLLDSFKASSDRYSNSSLAVDLVSWTQSNIEINLSLVTLMAYGDNIKDYNVVTMANGRPYVLKNTMAYNRTLYDFNANVLVRFCQFAKTQKIEKYGFDSELCLEDDCLKYKCMCKFSVSDTQTLEALINWYALM